MSHETENKAAFPEARQKQLSNKKVIWLIALFGFMAVTLFGGVLGGLAGYQDAATGATAGRELLPWTLGIGATISFTLALLWSLQYWKSIDEMARRAHLDSWFWGGSVGAMPVLILGMIAWFDPTFNVDVIVHLAKSPTQAFGLGVLVLFGAMLLGYTVFWLIWWAKKR